MYVTFSAAADEADLLATLHDHLAADFAAVPGTAVETLRREADPDEHPEDTDLGWEEIVGIALGALQIPQLALAYAVWRRSTGGSGAPVTIRSGITEIVVTDGSAETVRAIVEALTPDAVGSGAAGESGEAGADDSGAARPAGSPQAGAAASPGAPSAAGEPADGTGDDDAATGA